jgi:putative transposase
MANTYSQIIIQIVFTVKHRENLISPNNRVELEKYISGIIENNGQKMLAIYAMPDHIHILVGMKPNISISDLVRDIKANSSRFINESNWIRGKFRWQEGFGAFSYSMGHLDSIVNYILNQEEHHRKRKFKDEYLKILEQYEIEYSDEYLFDWIE